ncbi:MAG: FAD-binding protein [Paracoccaceae bacterium]|nr:FAD-binding protein [Paracoccaceae bacterium]
MSPATEEDLAGILAERSEPLDVQGGGTRRVGASERERLSTAALTGITLYEPGALTLVARAGTPLAEIEGALAAEGQMLAFEPMDHRPLLGSEGEPTIGGVVAGNVSGPRRVQAGGCRDSLIGVRFVDGTGTIVKNGGRVMKNVTGYDLAKLMAGANGTLGVLTEVSFKVLPKPEAVASVLLEGLSVADAVRAMSKALASPFEVSGAAHAPVGVDGAPVTMIRVEGFGDSVAYRAEKLRNLLSEFGPVAVETREGRDGGVGTAAGWRWARDALALAEAEGDVWRVSVKPTDAPKAVDALDADRILLDWGGGLIWAAVPPGTDARARLKGIPGHATLVRADAESFKRLGAFEPESVPLAILAKKLRQQFDPKGILNPGLMG